MIGQLVWIKGDSHGDSLHDLDPVTRGVLRGNQGKGRSGSSAKSHDLAMIAEAASVQVRSQRNRLPYPHIRELRLLEVRIDPDLIERHHRHQGSSRADTLPELYRSVRYKTRHRRRKCSPAVVE